MNEDRRYSLGNVPPVDYEPGKPPEDAGLTFLADFYKTDKGTIKHLYTPIYEVYLRPLRDKAISLLEVGVASGCSLKMWSAYFRSGRITGIDNQEWCAGLCRGYDRISIEVGDARATKFAPESFDVIIDDGSHISSDIVAIFGRLWPALKKGGLYFIEDLRCTHNQKYVNNFGGTRSEGEFSRSHYLGWLDSLMMQMDDSVSDVKSFHGYRELLVLEKR